MKLDEVANQVANNMPKKQGEAALDPAMIPVIIDIVSNLITMFKSCNKTPGEALKSAKSPSRWEKIALNQTVRKQLGMGFFKFRREGDDLVDAVLKTGAKTTEPDMKELYEEVD